MNNEWLNALWGGLLIGLSVSLMLFWNGRVTGISGIVYGLFNPKPGDIAWRLNFVGGLIVGGLAFHIFLNDSPTEALSSIPWTLPLAGLLVGFGTVLGSGCTSGHGVCGISRLSPRSLVATLLFMMAGISSVFALKTIGVIQ